MSARPRVAKSLRIQNPASPSCFAVITACISMVRTRTHSWPRGVKSYGIFPAAITAETAGSMHGDAEHVPLATIVEASDVLFDALRDTLAR